MNHNNLPSIASATLPQSYQAAQQALAECARVDECQAWADKAEALASYARQSKDETMLKMAMRIKARAIRREGELFKQVEPSKGGYAPNFDAGADAGPSTRKALAEEAGISPRQMKTAIRTANLDADEFEAAVESDNPPTITEMANAGKKPKPRNIVDLQGRDPDEFNAALHFVGMFRRIAEDMIGKCGNTDRRLSILTNDERAKIRQYIGVIDAFNDSIITRL